jgi:hypothetical protein
VIHGRINKRVKLTQVNGLVRLAQRFSLASFQHQPPASQQYFSLTTNQHRPPASRTRNHKDLKVKSRNELHDFGLARRGTRQLAKHDYGGVGQ